MASREVLLKSIQPGMRLDRNFFLRIYGYSITTPGFAEEALGKLESVGCCKARIYYTDIVGDYERKQDKAMKDAGKWYVKQLNEKWERQVRNSIAGNRKSRYQFAGFPENW